MFPLLQMLLPPAPVLAQALAQALIQVLAQVRAPALARVPSQLQVRLLAPHHPLPISQACAETEILMPAKIATVICLVVTQLLASSASPTTYAEMRVRVAMRQIIARV